MQNVGLSVQYTQADGAVREHVRSVALLAHLPPADILEEWLALMGECPIDVHPQLENFNDYFVETWRADDANIPVGFWNVSGEDQKRTNNNVEGWNSKFSKHTHKHHPNIFEFVDAIRKEQAATELKTAQHDAAVQPARKKKKYIVVVYFVKGEPRNVEYCKVFLWKCNIWVLRTRKLPDAKFCIHSILRN